MSDILTLNNLTLDDNLIINTNENNTNETNKNIPIKKYPYDLNEEEQILLEKVRKENPNVPFYFILEFFVSIKKWTPEQHKLYQEGNMKELIKTFNKEEGKKILHQIEDFEDMMKDLKESEVFHFDSEKDSDEYFNKIIEERDRRLLQKTLENNFTPEEIEKKYDNIIGII